MGNCAGTTAPHQPHSLRRPATVLDDSTECLGYEKSDAEAHTIQHAQVIPKIKGTLCGSYRLDRGKLGSGTYGTVCRAVHGTSGHARAIKTVRHTGMKSLRALHTEIATMQAMDHPNVIKLFEAYEDNKVTYMVMELCEGGELLDKIIEAKYFGEREAAIVMQQILRAVRYVHDKDIAHRDLKPQNFLLLSKDKLEDNTLKLIDFGFACPCKHGDVLRTRAGTALYVAPQVLTGRYDKQCDLWSAGVTLYALLSGRAPFTGSTDQEIFDKVKKGKFNLEGNNWRRMSNEAKDLIRQLLKMNPKERLTAEQALKHTWITQKMPRSRKVTLESSLVERLQGFRVRNKLERAVLKIIARHLSEDKVKDLRDAFEALDANCDGKLTIQELRSGLKSAGFEQNGLDLPLMMAMADADGSGEIDYSEFLVATLDRSRYLTDDALLAAFRVFDRNGDGCISEEELKQVLCTCSCEMDDCCRRVLQILNDLDVNGNGIIDFEEFKGMMHGWDAKPCDKIATPPSQEKEVASAPAAQHSSAVFGGA